MVFISSAFNTASLYDSDDSDGPDYVGERSNQADSSLSESTTSAGDTPDDESGEESNDTGSFGDHASLRSHHELQGTCYEPPVWKTTSRRCCCSSSHRARSPASRVVLRLKRCRVGVPPPRHSFVILGEILSAASTYHFENFPSF